MSRDQGYAKGRAKQEQILDAAVAVFGEGGYRGASLREIAARSGLSHPGLLHHFPTKEALLLAVLARREDADRAGVVADGITGATRLRRVVDVVAVNATRPAIVELFVCLAAEATTPQHPAHDYFAERYRTLVARVTDAYREAQADGALRAGIEPEPAARELVALMDGLQVQWLYDPGIDMAAIVRARLDNQLISRAN